MITLDKASTAASIRPRSSAATAGLLVVGATVANVALALALRGVFDISDDFEPLQPGAIAGATAVSLLVGWGALALLRRRWPARADRTYAVAVVVATVVSMLGPISLAGEDATSVAGWSAAGVWALVPLHLVPAIAGLALPRLRRR